MQPRSMMDCFVAALLAMTELADPTAGMGAAGRESRLRD
jgi:hypothetical protein